MYVKTMQKKFKTKKIYIFETRHWIWSIWVACCIYGLLKNSEKRTMYYCFGTEKSLNDMRESDFLKGYRYSSSSWYGWISVCKRSVCLFIVFSHFLVELLLFLQSDRKKTIKFTYSHCTIQHDTLSFKSELLHYYWYY